MRKYIFNASIIGALFGGVSAMRQTIRGPRNWRTILIWVIWLLSVVVAVGEVVEQSREAEDEYYEY